MTQLTDIMPAQSNLDIVNSGIGKSRYADEPFDLYFETAQYETAESVRDQERCNEPDAQKLYDGDNVLCDDQPVEQSDEQKQEVSQSAPEQADEQVEDEQIENEQPVEQVSDEQVVMSNMLAEQPNTGVVREQVSDAPAAQQHTAGQTETSEKQIPQSVVQVEPETVKDQESEDGSQKSEVRSQESEDSSQKSEVRSQETEDSSKKSVVRSQETEDSGKESVVRSQETVVGSQESAQFGSDRQKHSKNVVEMVLDGGKSASDKSGQVQPLFDSQKADAPKDVDMQQNVDRVVKAVRANVGRGTSVVQLRLDPPELGTLRIEIRANQSGMSLQIQATSAKAQQLLQQNISELRAALEANGIQTNRIEVELRLDLRNDNLPDQQENQNNDQSRQQRGFQEQFQSQRQGQWQHNEDLSGQDDAVISTAADAGGDIAGRATRSRWQEINFNSVDVRA